MKKQETIKYISSWLFNYATNSTAKALVVGISGGVDSALVSTLCCLSKLPVYCLSLPIKQNASHLKRAEEQMKWLQSKFNNVHCETINLTNAFEELEKTLPTCDDEELLALSRANARSRLRMIALYHKAALCSGLVIGTGNKIEDFGVGFFTKWGDGAADLSPIADLTKTQVWELSTYLGIPESIVSAAPSDGLFDDDKNDETQTGASYKELEWAMQMWEQGKKSDDFSAEEKRVFDIFIKRNRQNQHKMKAIPICTLPKELLVD